MENQRLEVGVFYVDTIPDGLVDSVRAEVKNCPLNLHVEKRGAQTVAGVEWLLPTALAVYILKPYTAAILQEMGRDHYHAIKKVIVAAARRLVGKDKLVTISVVTSSASPQKTSGKYSVAFSSLITLSEKYKMKFLFDDTLTLTQIEEYADRIADFVSSRTSEEILEIIRKNRNLCLMDTAVCTYDIKAKELLILDPMMGTEKRLESKR